MALAMKRHKVPDPKSSHWQLKQQSLNTWAVWGCRKEVCWHCMKIYKHLEQLEIQPGLSFQNRWWNWRDPEGPLEHIPAPLCHQCYKSYKDKLQKKWRLTIGTSHKAEVFSSFCPLPHFTEGTIRERDVALSLVEWSPGCLCGSKATQEPVTPFLHSRVTGEEREL